jgi:hypothetical protein
VSRSAPRLLLGSGEQIDTLLPIGDLHLHRASASRAVPVRSFTPHQGFDTVCASFPFWCERHCNIKIGAPTSPSKTSLNRTVSASFPQRQETLLPESFFLCVNGSSVSNNVLRDSNRGSSCRYLLSDVWYR